MNLRYSFTHCGHNERGTTAVVFGLVTPLIFAMAAVALDYSYTASDRTTAQAGADSAALAAVIEANRAKGTLSERREYAQQMGAKAFNVAAEGLQITSKDVVVTEKLDGAAVTAWGKTRVKLLQVSDAAEHTYKVFARAGALNRASVCLLAMDNNGSPGIFFKGTGRFKGPDCVIWSNSTRNDSLAFQGSSDVSAQLICAVGGVSKQGSDKITPAPESQCEPFADPFATWAPPSVSTACGFTNVTRDSGTVTMAPGVYCGNTTISADNVTFSPGVFVVKNGTMTIKGKAKITGSKILILMSGTSSLDLNGSGELSISGDPALASKSVVIAAADNTASGTVNLLGNTKLEVQGSIYLPKHTVEVLGNSDLVMTEAQTTVVAKTITVSGSGSIVFKGRETSNSPRWLDGTSSAWLSQ